MANDVVADVDDDDVDDDCDHAFAIDAVSARRM